MRFFLGTHEQSWLHRREFEDVPLFVSRRRMARQRRHQPAVTDWALDSGGFSELSMYGMWTVSPVEYVQEVRRWSDEVGRLQWAAIQDWMCEPWITSKTFPTLSQGQAIKFHQALTIESYLELRGRAPEIQWTPVVQGWRLSDYLDHVEQYDRSGVDLRSLPVVGVGSVCRRQGTQEAAQIFQRLAGLGLSCHGFGVKTTGLVKFAHHLVSADSMAWSDAARPKGRDPGIRLQGCDHKTCANCPKWARLWMGRIHEAVGRNNYQTQTQTQADHQPAPNPEQASLW
jgi:hypothetical protein